jgi:hypothetical protein
MALINTLQGNLAAIRQSTSIEVRLGAAPQQNQPITFGNQNSLLDDAVITSVEAFYADILSLAPSGNPLIPLADINKLTVTLNDNSGGKQFDFIQNYPYYNLISGLNAGIVKEIMFRRITLNKSSINIIDVGVTPNTSVVLAFNYWTKEQYLQFCDEIGVKQTLYAKPGTRAAKR